jgi:Zn ribbon nucleic-acid-binding protein
MVDDSRNTETPTQTRNHLNRMLYNKLFYVLTERYENKQETIVKWIEKDRQEQDRYDNTPAPADIHCSCGSPMRTTFKDLYSGLRNKSQKMLFFFECPDCNKRRSVFEDGKEWKVPPKLCPKCEKKVTEKITKKDGVLTTTTTCKACGFTNKEVDEFEKRHAEWEKEHAKEEKKDAALLKQYRSLFCLTETQGQAALNEREAIEVAAVIQKEEQAKYDSPAYTQASQLKRLKVADLEKYLIEPLTKAKYIKFSLDKPKDGPGFIVPFSAQDADSSRNGRASEYELRQLIKKLLEDTNWRLMTGNISYRLGYLSGRIRGYDSEQDLMELYEKEQPKKPVSSITREMREKHAHNRWVRLAHLGGKVEGTERARKRLLEKEPDGFFLENKPDSTYSCGVCGDHIPSGRTWWRPEGLSCADCHRNIKEGVIPDLLKQGDETYIKEWQINSDYSVHPSTRRMLERKDILKSRKLKRHDGSEYETIYLIEENAEFIKQYPKKPRMETNFVFPWTKEGINVDPEGAQKAADEEAAEDARRKAEWQNKKEEKERRKKKRSAKR